MKIKVKVKPNSKEQGVKKVDDGYVVSLKSEPKENKANIELIKLMSKVLKKEIKIKSGLRSKNKIIEVK